jgi:small-conductance mechanosensitive channel
VASLGIGSLAVALALQDTLANLFAFSLPGNELVVTVDAGVDYGSELQHVEQVTLRGCP